MLREYTRLARPFFVMLAIVAVGRWLQGTAFGVPYEKGTHVFSIVTLTLFASLFSAIFTRAWLGWRLAGAAGFAMFMAVVAQLVILLSTAASYGLGIPSYFSHPTALNQPEAVGLRPGDGASRRRPRGQHAPERHRRRPRLGARRAPPRPGVALGGEAGPGTKRLDGPKALLLACARTGDRRSGARSPGPPTVGGLGGWRARSFRQARLGRPIRSWSKAR